MSGAHTHEEVAWLASYRMTADAIARRLGLSVDAVQAHARGDRGGSPIAVYTEPDPPALLPAHPERNRRPR